MAENNSDKSPAETFGELRTMVTDYARQETVEPVKVLGKWIGFGVAGALMVGIGVSYLAFALLRWTQGLDVFEGDTRNFWPYLIAFGGLLVATGVMVFFMTRKFSDDD